METRNEKTVAKKSKSYRSPVDFLAMCQSNMSGRRGQNIYEYSTDAAASLRAGTDFTII